MTASNDKDEIVVTNNPEQHRYEINLNNEVAILTYKRGQNSITFLHTEVPPALGGKGLANKLAHFALEEARAQQLSVIPLCPFVAAYIRRHPNYLPLLPASEQRRITQA